MAQIHFTVDSQLLRELGERLVGRPEVALAELIKNGYDADATAVEIRFSADSIEVFDNGHGMTFDEFRDFWMRIGSAHKAAAGVSRNLKRPLTGSKGVGRLSVQFLAGQLEMHTVAENSQDSELVCWVDWGNAVKAGELTQATVDYEIRPRTLVFPGGKTHGTKLILGGLNQSWSSNELENLARQVWWLQPPFGSSPNTSQRLARTFEIELTGIDRLFSDRFTQLMTAALDLWHACLVGKIAETNGKQIVQLNLEFSGGPKTFVEYPVEYPLSSLAFEIRIFHLQYRQRFGLRIDDIREYLNQNGGVHVYDAGFRLPYYGPESDWLHIEMDHSHRLSRSKLLPAEMQIADGLSFLPTNSRLLGVVLFDSSLHQQSPGITDSDRLMVQVTRDRLVDNRAYRELVRAVRWSLDYYAMQEAARQFEAVAIHRPTEPLIEKVERIDTVLDKYRESIPAPAFSTLKTEIDEVVRATQYESEIVARQVGLLGALATAGMAALAYEHEESKQRQILKSIVDQLFEMASSSVVEPIRLRVAALNLQQWLDRSQALRRLFLPLMNEEDRERVDRYRVRPLVDEVIRQMSTFLRGIKPETDGIDEHLRFPPGRFSEWSAILQNVLTNALNATADSEEKTIAITTMSRGRDRWLLVSDTGTGIDIATSDELFQPFKRKLRISTERRALGIGGTGLGLTIVKMIATDLGCRVSFVDPTPPYRTAFQLLWREQT